MEQYPIHVHLAPNFVKGFNSLQLVGDCRLKVELCLLECEKFISRNTLKINAPFLTRNKLIVQEIYQSLHETQTLLGEMEQQLISVTTYARQQLSGMSERDAFVLLFEFDHRGLLLLLNSLLSSFYGYLASNVGVTLDTLYSFESRWKRFNDYKQKFLALQCVLSCSVEMRRTQLRAVFEGGGSVFNRWQIFSGDLGEYPASLRHSLRNLKKLMSKEILDALKMEVNQENLTLKRVTNKWKRGSDDIKSRGEIKVMHLGQSDVSLSKPEIELCPNLIRSPLELGEQLRIHENRTTIVPLLQQKEEEIISLVQPSVMPQELNKFSSEGNSLLTYCNSLYHNQFTAENNDKCASTISVTYPRNPNQARDIIIVFGNQSEQVTNLYANKTRLPVVTIQGGHWDDLLSFFNSYRWFVSNKDQWLNQQYERMTCIAEGHFCTTLALVVALSEMRSFRKPDYLIFHSPVLYNNIDLSSSRLLQVQDFLNNIKGYDMGDPWTSPALLPDEIIAKYPPTYFSLASLGSALDDGVHFTRRLASNGVPISIHLFDRLGNDYLQESEFWKNPAVMDAIQTSVNKILEHQSRSLA